MNPQFWSLEAIKQLELEKGAIEKKLEIAHQKFIKEHCPYKPGDTLIIDWASAEVKTEIKEIKFVRGLIDGFYGIVAVVTEKSATHNCIPGEHFHLFSNNQIIQHIPQPKNKKENA